MRNIQCKMFGHDYQVTRNVTYHVKEYTCSHCKRQLTTNSNGSLTELTPKFKEINDVLERIHHNRIVRKQRAETKPRRRSLSRHRLVSA